MSDAWFKQLISQFSAIKEHKIAFSLYDGNQITDITYPQFAADVLAAAGYFVERGICDQHIALLASGGYRWVVSFFSIIATGNVAVPLNQALPSDMLRWQCEKASVDLICYDDVENVEKLSCCSTVSLDQLCGNGAASIDHLCCKDNNSPILMMFTSGTTGISKLVVLSAENLATSVDPPFLEVQHDCTPNRCLLSLPLYHIGSIREMLSRIYKNENLLIGRGAKYVFMDIPKLNPTHVGMVPAMAESFAKILKRMNSANRESIVGNCFKGILAVGASMKPDVAEFLLKKGIEITVKYGMTESAGHGSWGILDENHIGSIGKPDKNMTFDIKAGEILLRSNAVMQGYYNDPEETDKVIVDGWLHTGDMGYCDKNGYYYITGRKKNVIILANGENVNPEEIETAFGACASIEECLVYSDGKGICADVFTKEQEVVTAFINAYNSSVPMYRQVYKVNYTSEPLPKTGSGKIKRKENK